MTILLKINLFLKEIQHHKSKKLKLSSIKSQSLLPPIKNGAEGAERTLGIIYLAVEKKEQGRWTKRKEVRVSRMVNLTTSFLRSSLCSRTAKAENRHMLPWPTRSLLRKNLLRESERDQDLKETCSSVSSKNQTTFWENRRLKKVYLIYLSRL